MRNGGRLGAIDRGVLKCLFDYCERNGYGMLFGADASQLNPNMAGVAKTDILGIGPIAKLRKKMVETMVKRYVSKHPDVEQWDVLVSHSARPQTVSRFSCASATAGSSGACCCATRCCRATAATRST